MSTDSYETEDKKEELAMAMDPNCYGRGYLGGSSENAIIGSRTLLCCLDPYACFPLKSRDAVWERLDLNIARES